MTAEAVQAHPREQKRIDLTAMETNRLGMFIFLIGEAVFFGLLILSFVYFRRIWYDGQHGPTARVLNVPATAIFTLFLLASSGTVWLAERAIRAGNAGAMKLWLAATVVLGAIFLAGQGIEYYKLIQEGITIRTGLFGSTFFTVTGFHGLHVFIGLVMLTILLGLAIAGDYTGSTHSPALDAISLYWHFVDIVWVFVFSVIYLWALIS